MEKVVRFYRGSVDREGKLGYYHLCAMAVMCIRRCS